MSQRFDFVIAEARAQTLQLQACNDNWVGTITATARPVFSLPTAVLQGYGIPFGIGEALVQYSQSAGSGSALINPVEVPVVNLSVTASGKNISIAIPFGATFNGNTPEYISGGSPRRYTLVVSHNGVAVLSGLIQVDIAAPVQAAFSICNAEIM